MFKYMNNTRQSFLIICNIILIFQIEPTFNSALAQKMSYKINVEDLLEISFWESPDMDQQVRVGSEGNITLPVIGAIKAEGLTTGELSQAIIREMGMYNKLINQIRIKVLEYGQNRVHVTGQVTSPGKYSFEEIPNLWDIILEAGGPLEEAQLDEVVIVRNREDGKIITANVTFALKRGEVTSLPQIYPGDAIHIPGTSSPFGAQPSTGTDISSRNEFYIVGAIGNPGVQQYESNLNILDAIGRAGGPTAEANINEIKYVGVHQQGTRVWNIDLEFYINTSISNSLPTITPGSTIYIPPKPQMSPIWQAIIVTTVSTALTTVVVWYLSDNLR
jgi:protein involved in polysaccharide export with SLBB domain